MTVRLLRGDVRAMLGTLPAESVHCVVTSVPYWGLRAYGTEPQVWFGILQARCEHEWGDEGDHGRRGNRGVSGTGGNLHPTLDKAGIGAGAGGSGSFCRHCNAWRGEHGQEPTPELYIANEVAIWREVRRVLRKDGVAWLNIGDSYATTSNGRPAAEVVNDDRTYRDKPFSTVGGTAKAKDLCLIPEQLAIALRKDGWWVRSRIPWVKRSAMPDSTTDRPGQAVEYFFMLTRSARYFFDMAAVRQEGKEWNGRAGTFARDGEVSRHILPNQSAAEHRPDRTDRVEPGRNLRNADLLFQSLEAPHGLISSSDGDPLALDVNTAGFAEAHFATFPPKLIEPLIKASTSERGCCVECGAPWVRVVETTGGSYESRKAAGGGGPYNLKPETYETVGGSVSKTLDWQPSCSCEPAEPLQRATVLDIFGGSGTTGLVADRLGRDAVLIELQPEYAEMAEQRIKGDAPLFTEIAT